MADQMEQQRKITFDMLCPLDLKIVETYDLLSIILHFSFQKDLS